MVSFAGAGAAPSPIPIKIPIHNWSSQIVGANIVGKILNEAGYEVEYIPADSQVVYTSMCEGDIDLVHEVWQGAFGVAFEKVVAEGCVIDAGDPRRQDPRGVVVSGLRRGGLPGPARLGGAQQMRRALLHAGDRAQGPLPGRAGRLAEARPRAGRGPRDGLRGGQRRFGGALWAELGLRLKRKQPIVLFNWTPNFIEAIYDGKFIEFPAYDEACKDDPAWGMNPDKTYDCGNPKDGYLKIGVWKGMPGEVAGRYKILQGINFSNLDIAVMAKLADVDGMEPEEAADQWLADNEAKWRGLAGRRRAAKPIVESPLSLPGRHKRSPGGQARPKSGIAFLMLCRRRR